MDRVLQIKRLYQRRQIVGVGVHFVAVPGLARPAMASAVMRYAAESAIGQKKHLVFERVRAQGPPMAENDWLTLSPILVVDLSPIFGCDCRH